MPTVLKSVPLLGKTVLWYGGSTFDAERVLAGLTAANLAHLKPSTQSPRAALSEAMSALYRGHEVNVGPVKGALAYAVLDKVSDPATLNVETYQRLAATLEPRGQTSEYDVRVIPHPKAIEPVDAEAERRRIEGEYQRQLGRISKDNVTTMLVAVCRAIGGTPINPDGGVYFIPDAAMTVWDTVATAVEKASGTACRVQGIETARTPGAIRAIAEGFTADMEAKLDRMTEELNTKGVRAAMNRNDECLSLADLAEQYEAVLGEAHGRILARIAEVQARASQTAMRQEAVESGTGSSLADQL